MDEFQTPMMQQYFALKEKYADCLLFFRLGDFYEMFMDDAKIASNVLSITLTSRDRGKDGRIPMAGVPYHAVDAYLSKLVKAGYKVAICEQLTQPKPGELVQRDVVRIVTPGTLFDEHALQKDINNYIFTIYKSKNKYGVALCDVSTGKLLSTEFIDTSLSEFLQNYLQQYNPTECVLDENLLQDQPLLSQLRLYKNLLITNYASVAADEKRADVILKKSLDKEQLDWFVVNKCLAEKLAIANILSYLNYTQRGNINHIKTVIHLNYSKHMLLDRFTVNSLELFHTMLDGSKHGSLIGILDKTSSPMGGRMLKEWLARPLLNTQEITYRSHAVSALKGASTQRARIQGIICEIPDIERILSRISVGIGNPRDVFNIKQALEKYFESMHILITLDSPLFHDAASVSKEKLERLVQLISSTFVDEPPVDPKSGGVICAGINAKLDDLKAAIFDSKEFVANLESLERQKTGINTLKVRYNKVFGYYIEVTHANSANVPSSYERKQTLVNAERYITEDLKHHEQIILSAEEDIKSLEYEIFLTVVDAVVSVAREIQEVADKIAVVDCILSLTLCALEYRWCLPRFIDENSIEIISGRHPVVEASLPHGDFVSNDTKFDLSDNLFIITGPNMAGKSVFIRQVALIVLLAQIGSYVPAKSAVLSLRDRIFVRSGASDAIGMGYSTFMLEMLETAYILKNCTSQSFVVMDEIGRGTSTYDGISIAWSVANYLATAFGEGPKTLFATHYHELQRLEEVIPQKVSNYHVTVHRENDTLLFLHKLARGSSEHSFGIDVAKIAGLPQGVIKSSYEILSELEKKNTNDKETA